jgi:hypothetical protein
MPIKIPDIDRWNAWLGGEDSLCQCCGMTECDSPEHEMKDVTRNLCAIKCLATDPWTGTATPFPEANDDVPNDEILAAFRSVTVAWTQQYGDTASDCDNWNYTYTFRKEPKTQEENIVGIYGCAICHFGGTETRFIRAGDQVDWAEDHLDNAVSGGRITPYGQSGGLGGTHTTYEYIGGVLDSSSTESWDTDYDAWSLLTTDTEVTELVNGALHFFASKQDGTDYYAVELTFDPYDARTALDDLNNAIDDLDDGEWSVTVGDTSSLYYVDPVSDGDFPDPNPRIQGAVLRRAKIRWKIPYPWERSETQTMGSYCMVEWQLLHTPQEYSEWEDAGDPEEAQPEHKPLLVEAPGSPWTWTYPTGDWATWAANYIAWITGGEIGAAPTPPAGDDPWYSEWFDIPMPERGDGNEPYIGEVEVVNSKLSCYHGAVYGSKPTPNLDFAEFDPHPDR